MKKNLSIAAIAAISAITLTACSSSNLPQDNINTGNATSDVTQAVSETSDGSAVSDGDVHVNVNSDISLVDYNMSYHEKDIARGITGAVIPFPSSIASEDSITELYNAEDFTQFMNSYSDLWGNKPEDIVSMDTETFEFHHDWYQNVKFTGQGGMRYFAVSSPDFSAKSFLEINEDEDCFYDSFNNTMYICLQTDLPYSDYLSVGSQSLADKVDTESAATYAVIALELGDYDIDNLVIVKPKE